MEISNHVPYLTSTILGVVTLSYTNDSIGSSGQVQGHGQLKASQIIRIETKNSHVKHVVYKIQFMMSSTESHLVCNPIHHRKHVTREPQRF